MNNKLKDNIKNSAVKFLANHNLKVQRLVSKEKVLELIKMVRPYQTDKKLILRITESLALTKTLDIMALNSNS